MFELIGKIFSFIAALLGRARDIVSRDKTLNEMRGQIGEMLSLIKQLREDSAQKAKALARLESDTAMLMELVTSGPADAVFLADANGEMFWLSPTYGQITGLNLELAKHEGWLRAIATEYRMAVLNGWNSAIETDSVYVADYVYVNIASRVRTPVHCDAQPVFRSDPSQTTIGWVVRITRLPSEPGK